MPNTNAFEKAVKLLPEKLRKPLLFLPTEMQATAEELRLRCGKGICLTVNNGVIEMKTEITADNIWETLDHASNYSFYTVQESMKQGFLTAPGGLRIGLGGSVILQDGQIQGFRSVSSLCIRIPHCVECVSDAMYERLKNRNVLICAAPGGGKTTFLRDLVRRISDAGKRVSLLDERGELAAMSSGAPQFDIGQNTDVLEFCPKTEAAELMLRAMNPQVIAMDELSRLEFPILEKLQACGVYVIATAHAECQEDLYRKGMTAEMFDCLIHIRAENGKRSYEVLEVTKC